jgi:hypothetical protein
LHSKPFKNQNPQYKISAGSTARRDLISALKGIQALHREIYDHPPYSSNLVPSDYHLFTKMKVWLATQRFHTNEELMDGVNNWLHNLATPFFNQGLKKQVSQYDKHLNVGGNYAEK